MGDIITYYDCLLRQKILGSHLLCLQALNRKWQYKTFRNTGMSSTLAEVCNGTLRPEAIVKFYREGFPQTSRVLALPINSCGAALCSV